LPFDVTRMFNFSNASLVFLQNKGFMGNIIDFDTEQNTSNLSLEARPVNTIFLSFVLNTVERMLAITSHLVAQVGFLAATSVARITSFNIERSHFLEER